MIIWIAGMSCVGKSTIFRRIIDNTKIIAKEL
jgi:uridine kinase